MLRRGIFALALLTLILLAGAVAIALRPVPTRYTFNTAVPATVPPRTLKDEIPPLVPKAPAEALKTFKTLDGFRMELVASEPQVTSPVAAAYDEDGRLYVVEMRDYPNPNKPGETPLGRVRLLEDRDGDGVYEQSHVFAEALPWPTGVACWDGGIYVTAAPDIWYFKDTDGDGKADVRRKVYTGFVVHNVQALVNGLQWGVDNRIYGVTAANGGNIQPAEAASGSSTGINVRGRDFRFDPATGQFEAISGTAQFGNAFDDWYNRFLCANRMVAGHVVLPSRYLARNPNVPAGRLVQDCAIEGVEFPLPMFQISPSEPWREVRTRRYHAEGMKLPTSEMVVKGIFTSGTGIAIYRGNAYPEKYRGHAFVGNVAGNLVHRRRLSPNGASFIATRADQDAEFLASTDNWFRPVNMLNAPDGTLHVLDMYREVVEHPWSLPEDIRTHLDLSSGRDRGRIYRLAPASFQRPTPPRLGAASTEQLVATLENPNAWWRETAQRLLYQKKDSAAVPHLRRLLRTSVSPLGQLHALWTLHGLAALENVDIAVALNSSVAGLREHGVQLAEPRLKESPELASKVVALSDDADARVRFQAALTLGDLSGKEATSALARIARRDAKDPWIRLAVLSGSTGRADQLVQQLLQDKADAAAEPALAILQPLAAVVGARNRYTEVARVLVAATEAPGSSRQVQRELILGLGDGLARAGKTLQSLKLAADELAGRLLQELFDEAKRAASDDKATIEARTQATLLLAHAEFTAARPTLRTLLDPRQPQPLQLAAVRALRATASADVPPLLLERWAGYTPVVRAEVLTTLAGRTAWATALLDAVAARQIAVGHVDTSRRSLLLKSRDAQVRKRAAELLGDLAKTPRADVVGKYRPALDTKGDVARGRTIFQRECASCHISGGVGYNVGPSIAAMGTKTPDTLLVNILDPNREVDPRYLNYHLVTHDGRVTTGVIAGETDTSVVLRRADGASETILRTQIDELSSTGQSLMPEGLEQKISTQEMSDLIAFLMEVP